MITVKRCRRLQYTVSWPEWALLVTWEKTNKKERNKCCFFSFQTELSISKQLCIESLKDFCFPHLRWGLFTISWSFLCSVHTYNQSQYIYNKYDSKLLSPVVIGLNWYIGHLGRGTWNIYRTFNFCPDQAGRNWTYQI